MSKAPSPLLGYNNNVRHKNRVFHVQTEDSGIKHPHIITHLFMDGGRILKSVKKSYAEYVGTDGMADVVRNMMKEQHKAMLIALRDGQFDYLVDPKAAKPAAPPASDATTVDAQPPVQPPPPASSAGQPRPASRPPQPAAAVRQPSQPPAKKGSVRPPPVTAAAKAPSIEETPATTRNPPQSSAGGGHELTLDMDALERASKDNEPSPVFQQPQDLPPPPQNLFRGKSSVTGQYRAVTPPPEVGPQKAAAQSPQPASAPGSRPPPSQRRPASSPPRRSSPPQAGAPQKPPSSPPRQIPPFQGAKPPAKPTPGARPGEGRYAPARPAAIFGQGRPQNAPPASLFGEDLISDKSLDEVILSYLAEDLEPADKKKR